MLVTNYFLQGNMSEFSKNPEMFQHLEANLSLYTGVNNVLKQLQYQNLRYADLIHPSKFKKKKCFSLLSLLILSFETKFQPPLLFGKFCLCWSTSWLSMKNKKATKKKLKALFNLFKWREFKGRSNCRKR